MQRQSRVRGRRAVLVTTLAVLGLCTGQTVLASVPAQPTSASVPEISASSLSAMQFGPMIANPAGHGFSGAITSLPLNSPPINGFVPQVVFGLTDELDPDDFSFVAHRSSVPGGNTMPFFGSPYYSTAVFDTGSQSHLISFADTQTFDFASANREGDSEQEIIGASGSEFCDVSDGIGVYMTGFANASVGGGGVVSVTPGTLVGHYNAPVLTAQPGSTLPNLIGAPMAAQYQTTITNTNMRHLTIGGQTVRTPQVSLGALNTALPAGYVKITLSVQSVNGVSADPVFFPSIENIENVADNPITPSFWASFFAKTNITHTGGTASNQDFLFDTGAQVSVMSEETANSIGILTGGPNPTPPDFFVEVQGVGGTSQNVPGFYINSLSLTSNGGPITFSHVPILMLDILDPRDATGAVPGILGTNLFGDYNMIINGGTAQPFLGLSPQWMWKVDSNGSWSTSTNWNLAVPNGMDTQANFLGAISAPRTITVDGAGFTVGSLTFDNANRYTLNGPGRITLQTSAEHAILAVGTGSHTINAPMTFASDIDVTIALPGSTLTVTSDVTATGIGITKEGLGTFEMKNLRAASLTVNNGKVLVTANGTNAGASRLSALTIAGGATPTAKLDLTNNAMVLDYTGSSPAATIRALLQSGFNNGSWTGNGLTSSTAASQAGASHKTAIGYGEASALGNPATWFGQSADSTSLLLRYAYFGDANLNGTVDTTDFNILAANFGGANMRWDQADFTYDGNVDTLDFNTLAANFGLTLPSDSFGSLIPEPTTGAIAFMATALLVRARRK